MIEFGVGSICLELIDVGNIGLIFIDEEDVLFLFVFMFFFFKV